MTIPTPTSNPQGAAGHAPGLAGLTPPGAGSPPPGLPDEASLLQLASAFFARLPGDAEPSLPASAPTAPSPVSAAPAAPASVGELNLASAAPSIAPQPVAPDVADPLGGASHYAVPEAYAAALPPVTPPQAATAVPLEHVPAPSTPYYFLGEGSPHAAAASHAAPVDNENRVGAQSFGLPGDGELKRLLDELAGNRHTPIANSEDKGSTGNAASASNGGFYFLDAPRHPLQAPTAEPSARPPFDVNAIRRDFPILAERVNGKPLVWFDNAATTHKPQAVIDRLAYFYAHENSNIHRAAHELAARATDAYEAARNKVARFIGAGSADEVIFVRGATEAINLVAKTWGAQNIGAGDEIVVSLLEHHANIVPWQQLAAATGAKIRVIPVDDRGQILLDEYQKLLTDKTKLVAITQVSNALGTITPVKAVIDLAHRVGAKVLVDGAQSVSHIRVNVQALDADFFVFSGHKIFAPTGIGVVWGKAELLETMPPWQGGGNMIADVTFERTLFQPAPNKFEAGTGNIADAVGLGAALDYVERIGLENIARYEHDLLAYAMRGLAAIPGVRLIGTAAEKTSVASFVLAGYKTDEVGQALNAEGIAVRTGHHCAQPILRRFGLETTVRPSLAFYNTCQEVDLMLSVVQRLANGRSRAA